MPLASSSEKLRIFTSIFRKKVILGGENKRWLKIIFGTIPGDSGYFCVLKQKVPLASSSGKSNYLQVF